MKTPHYTTSILAFAWMAWTCLATAATATDAPVQVQVFQRGKDGYPFFRIPAIVRATNGSLLAFAEGRRNGYGGDSGAIDTVLKRSFDNGATWGPLQVVSSDASNTVGNPTPIVDSRTGRIVLLTTRNEGKDTEAELDSGACNDRRAYLQASADNGVTWSAAKEITADVKRSTWRYYATGPVHGIQLARGSHAGRLIAPCNFSILDPSGAAAWGAHLLYSDDGGASWLIGAVNCPANGVINPNECAAIELTDGSVYAVARNEGIKAPGHRVVARSRDAGLSFEAPFALDLNLVSPIVQGCVLRYSATDQGESANRILFSAPGDLLERTNMTVRSSFDEARTWSAGKLIYNGPSAYSDMVKLPGGMVGLLYESGIKGPYERITFVILTTGFLDASLPKEKAN